MRVVHALRIRPMMAILAATVLVVALACGGEEATPTSRAYGYDASDGGAYGDAGSDAGGHVGGDG